MIRQFIIRNALFKRSSLTRTLSRNGYFQSRFLLVYKILFMQRLLMQKQHNLNKRFAVFTGSMKMKFPFSVSSHNSNRQEYLLTAFSTISVMLTLLRNMTQLKRMQRGLFIIPSTVFLQSLKQWMTRMQKSQSKLHSGKIKSRQEPGRCPKVKSGICLTNYLA